MLDVIILVEFHLKRFPRLMLSMNDLNDPLWSNHSKQINILIQFNNQSFSPHHRKPLNSYLLFRFLLHLCEERRVHHGSDSHRFVLNQITGIGEGVLLNRVRCHHILLCDQ